MSDTFGWIPFDERDAETNAAHDRAVSEMPEFRLIGDGQKTSSKTRVVLWEAAKAVNGGKHLPTLHQSIGSCVGMGKANAERMLACADIVVRGDRERYIEIFEPYGYGRSRLHAGIRGRGSGSTGSGAAKAARIDGVVSIENEGLTGWTVRNGSIGQTLYWDGGVDTKWSDGAAIGSEWVERGKKHLVRTTAQVTTYEQVRDALLNWYPVTVASSRGFQMRPVVDGGKHWGRPSGTWMHQMCFVGVDDDGRRPGCYCWNSWNAEAHGPPADDAPPGGFWVDAEVVTSMVRQGDSYAYSQFDGFPQQELDFTLIG